MNTYPISGLTRTCCISGRQLLPGEKFFTVLREESGQFLRKDYAADAWKEPPTDAIAWWGGLIPAAGEKQKPKINDTLLMECFEHIQDNGDPARQNFRCVLALLLMRRKRLKFEDTRKTPAGDVFLLKDAKSSQRYEVLDPRLSESEIATVQEEIFRVLGWE